jgi:hypothetical protein
MAFGKVLHLGLDIADVNSPSLKDGAPRDGSPDDWNETACWQGNRTVVSCQPQTFPVNTEHDRVVSSAEARGAPDYCVQHGSEICR